MCTKRPIRAGEGYIIVLPPPRSCLLSHSQSSGCFFSSVEEGSSRGGSIGASSVGTVGDVAGMHGGEDSTVNEVLGVGHHRGGLGPPDDGLAGNRGGDGNVVGGINVDGGGDLHDVLLVDRHIIGDLNATLDQDGVLDLVDLNLLLDDGGVVSNRALQDGGDRDGKMRGGGLEDPGGVAGDEAGLTEVHLLGDHGGGLVHGGDTGGLGGGGEGSRGRGGDIVDRVRHHGASGVVVSSGRGRANGVGGGSDSVGGNTVADGGLDRGDCVGNAVGVLGRSEGAGQDEGKCNLDNEIYEILQHSSHLGFDKKDIDFTSYSNQGMVSQKKMVGSLTKGLMLTAIFH